MLVLRHAEVAELLDGHERDVVEAVRGAYIAHTRGQTFVPHSTFVTPASWIANRVIALPAFLGDDDPVVGVKWISSFPDNIALGLERASAVIVTNSVETGRPEALIEGAHISAQRTAASAVLCAMTMHPNPQEASIAVVGAGRINFEVMRMFAATVSPPSTVRVYDRSKARAEMWADECEALLGDFRVTVVDNVELALRCASLVSLATTVSTPYLSDIDCTSPDAVILNISLRDIDPSIIPASRNIVDDIDHVFREGTSLQLAADLIGTRKFVDGTIGEVLLGDCAVALKDRVIVSPFGLGVLDLAVARLVLRLARLASAGMVVSGFLPGDHD